MDKNRKLLFEEEALKYLNSLYFFALKITKNKEEAENLVQETYLKAFKFSKSFKIGTNMKAWLFKILNNTFLSMKNYEKKIPIPQEDSLIESRATFYDVFQGKERVELYNSELILMKDIMDEDLEISFNSLSEDNRKLLFLIDIEGMSYEEVSLVLGISLGTVKSRVFRARNRLRNSFIRKKRLEERVVNNESL